MQGLLKDSIEVKQDEIGRESTLIVSRKITKKERDAVIIRKALRVCF